MTPHYTYQLDSPAGNLTVTMLNYGERQPGAETVDLCLSRPVAGCSVFHTTNGIARFSPSGARLLLHDLFVIILIDTQTMTPWCYQLPTRTLFYGLHWEGEILTGKTLKYGRSVQQADTFGPWDWAAITATWRPGLGGAADGELFCAFVAPSGSSQ